MKKITLAILCLISLVHTNCSASIDKIDYSKWLGKYEYSEVSGETVGGSPITEEVIFKIQKTNGKVQCLYSEDGMQTMVRAIFSLAEKDGKLYLYFEKWGEEHSFPTYEYKKGDLINTIEIKDNKYIVKFLKNLFKPDTYVFKKTNK